MRVDKLELNDYRNIKKATLFPHPKVNIIYGKNAQGKTNLLGSAVEIRAFVEQKKVRLFSLKSQRFKFYFIFPIKNEDSVFAILPEINEKFFLMRCR